MDGSGSLKAIVKRKSTANVRKTKSKDFLKRLGEDNSMVEYFTQLRIMNPPAEIRNGVSVSHREGGFVRLAHALEEFTAPVLSKGKSVQTAVRRKTKRPPKQR